MTVNLHSRSIYSLLRCFLLVATSPPIPMFTDCGLCTPFLGPLRRRRTSPDPDLDPVLLVSGMGGSILNTKNKKNGTSVRVWVRIFLANLEFRKYLWSLYNPETGYTESLDRDVDIVVPEDDYGLHAIDILDPSFWIKCLHVTDVYHFHDMIDMLMDCGYEKGTTLFGYGYDFRQSNRIDKAMDGLKEKLEIAYKSSGGKKVNLVSHSMGGLLTRCFLSLHHDLIECPSIYEMLPNPEFKWKKPPIIEVWRKQSDGKDDSSVKLDVYDPTQTTSLFEEALRNNKLKYDGKSVSVPFNMSIYKWAAETLRILDEAQLPSSVSFYNLFGISYETPYDVCYGTKKSPIDNLSEVCHTMPEYSYVDGDGTVPAESAMADGFPAKARVGVKGDHRGLLKDKTVFKLLKQWLGVNQVQSPSSSTSKFKDEFFKPDHQFIYLKNNALPTLST